MSKNTNHSLALLFSILLGPLLGIALPSIILTLVINTSLILLLSSGAIVFAYMITPLCIPTAKRYLQQGKPFIRSCTILGTIIGLAVSCPFMLGANSYKSLAITGGLFGIYGSSTAFITAAIFQKLNKFVMP